MNNKMKENSKIKESLENSFFDHPEDIFERNDLLYKSNEIERMILRFDAARHPKPVYTMVLELLRATINFRMATPPAGLFAEIRNANTPDETLKEFLTKMHAAILSAEEKLKSNMGEEDKKILQNALTYCKKSITERIASLDENDRLLSFWNESDLKKQVERN